MGRRGWLLCTASSAPQACSQGSHLHVHFWHFQMDNCYADLWYRELGLFPGPPRPSLCERGSLVRGKQHAVPTISNPPTGQRPGTATSSISSWLHPFLCLEITNARLASPPSLQRFFLDLREVIPSGRRHPVVEFVVIAERDTRLSVLVIEGMNLNPHPSLPSCTCSCSR